MDLGTFEEIKRYVDFSESDARVLQELQQPLEAHFGAIVDRFYEALLANENTRRVFTGGEEQIARLRNSLRQWLVELFSGRYDESYFRQRCAIGRTHLRVRLPQPYLFSAMTIIRVAVGELIEKLGGPQVHQRRSALEKILGIDMAIMDATYCAELLARTQALERRQFEQRLGESEHLATIGRLAASLAHEIKNPLAGISGAIQVIGAELGDSHPHKEVINEMMRQIDRLDAAVCDLLVYARPKPPDRKVQNVASVLKRALLLFREEPSCRNVSIVCEGLQYELEAALDDAQLQQVITNLLLNAAHACGPGGRIHCRLEPTPDGVRLTVEDNGCGIRDDVLPRVFEPFFTTKARGTGLGLPICKRIIETHGGTIRLESTAGVGTRVTIEIPHDHAAPAHPDH